MSGVTYIALSKILTRSELAVEICIRVLDALTLAESESDVAYSIIDSVNLRHIRHRKGNRWEVVLGASSSEATPQTPSFKGHNVAFSLRSTHKIPGWRQIEPDRQFMGMYDEQYCKIIAGLDWFSCAPTTHSAS